MKVLLGSPSESRSKLISNCGALALALTCGTHSLFNACHNASCIVEPEPSINSFSCRFQSSTNQGFETEPATWLIDQTNQPLVWISWIKSSMLIGLSLLVPRYSCGRCLWSMLGFHINPFRRRILSARASTGV